MVVAVDIPTTTEPHPDKPGWQIHRPGQPGAYAVVDRNWDNEQARYPTEAEACADADRRNLDEVERTLDPAYADRRRRLRALGATFWVRYGDGPIAARWPERPGRFAALEWSERYSESFWETYTTRDELEDAIRTGDVGHVVDLDTGDPVSFSVDVHVEIGSET
jgi:hypothetical protein